MIGDGAHLGACATMEARAGAADVEAIPQLGASTSASAEPASRARAARERVMWFLVSFFRCGEKADLRLHLGMGGL